MKPCDRRYALELMMRFRNSGGRIEKYLKGNWCDEVITQLLEADLLEIHEMITDKRRVLHFYVVTRRGELWLDRVVERAWEGPLPCST